MRAHLRAGVRKGFQGFIATILRGMVNNDEVGFAQIKIRGAGPERRTVHILRRLLAQLFGKSFYLLFIGFIRGSIRVTITGNHQEQQPHGVLKKFHKKQTTQVFILAHKTFFHFAGLIFESFPFLKYFLWHVL